jgi:methyl-accepting chemotaxis protein
MNAAIQAARADEAGKGFAVGPEQIRRLAVHSENQSKKMDHDLGDARQALETISAAINDVAAAFGALLEDVRKVDGLIGGVTETAMTMGEHNESASLNLEKIGFNNDFFRMDIDEAGQRAALLDRRMKDLEQTVAIVRSSFGEIATGTAEISAAMQSFMGYVQENVAIAMDLEAGTRGFGSCGDAAPEKEA